MKVLKSISITSIFLTCFLVAGLAQAQTIYTDRPTFDADNPGLLTEDFELGNVAPGGAVGCNEPLDATGDGVCFAPGDLLAGVSYSASGPGAPALAVVGENFSGSGNTKNLVANFFPEFFVMDFSEPDNTAVGFDVICFLGGPDVTIDVYGAGGLITSEPSACDGAGSVFFGISSLESITQIVVSSPSDAAEGVDNLSFGAGNPPEPRAVAYFSVIKDFSDNSPDAVEVSISCNTGLPLEQSFVIQDSQSDPAGALSPPAPGVVFVVTEFTDGTMDCTITETPVPGYAVDYTASGDSTSVDDDPLNPGCHFSDVAWEDMNACEIANDAADATFTVTKEWEIVNDGGDVVDESAQVTIQCDSLITDSNGYTYDCGGGYWCAYEYLGDGDSLWVEVSTLTGDAYCSVFEYVGQSGVETDADDCFSRFLSAGSSDSCVIYNTVFFEGIPTLSQYGLALLALLMLGVGFVGFRRVI